MPRSLVSYLRLNDEPDNGIPEAYVRARASGPDDVLAAIEALGGNAFAVEADLADESTPRLLFDAAEERFGPVDILINNASGWVADTFRVVEVDRLERSLRPLSASSLDHVFAVDARGAALMIAEFARRHRIRGLAWGRIVGLSSGGPNGFPRKCLTAPRRPRSKTSRCPRLTSWRISASLRTSCIHLSPTPDGSLQRSRRR
jgi:3-oxoacyl-[acyl-carrier protein] reductase